LLLRRGRLLTAATLLITLVASTAAALLSATSTTTVVAAAEELKIIADDFEPGALLAGGLVLPRIELESAFHVEWSPFFHVFSKDFGLAPPVGDVDKSCLLAALAVVEAVGPVDGEPDIGDGGSFGCVTHLGIAGQISDEHHFVKIRHGKTL